MERDPRLDALAASDLVSSSVTASLMGMLTAKGMLTNEEVRQVYEKALYLLEMHQADSEPEMHPIFEAAREIIEEQLRPDEDTETKGSV